MTRFGQWLDFDEGRLYVGARVLRENETSTVEFESGAVFAMRDSLDQGWVNAETLLPPTRLPDMTLDTVLGASYRLIVLIISPRKRFDARGVLHIPREQTLCFKVR